MSRGLAFIMLVIMIALGITNIVLLENKAPNAGLPLVNAYGSTMDDSWPPMRFRGDGAAWVHFVSPSRIAEVCGEKPDLNYPLEACQQGDVIVLPNPSTVTAEAFRRLAAHELGHRLGWAGNHPR